jgi:hypothetical protein
MQWLCKCYLTEVMLLLHQCRFHKAYARSANARQHLTASKWGLGNGITWDIANWASYSCVTASRRNLDYDITLA